MKEPKYIEPVDQQLRPSSVQVQPMPLTKLPSTESLTTSVTITTGPVPVSPGITIQIFCRY